MLERVKGPPEAGPFPSGVRGSEFGVWGSGLVRLIARPLSWIRRTAGMATAPSKVTVCELRTPNSELRTPNSELYQNHLPIVIIRSECAACSGNSESARLT